MNYVRKLYLLAIVLIGASSVRVVSFLTISDLFFCISAMTWLFLGFRGGARRSLLINGYVLGLLLIVLGGIASLLGSQDVAGSAFNEVKFIFTFFLFFVFGPAVLVSLRHYISLLAAFCMSVAITMVGVALQMAIGTNFFGIEPQWGRYSGFAEHPNELGMHCALGVFAGLALFRISGSRWDRMLGVFAIALSLIGVVASASMTAVAAILVASVLLGAYEVFRRRVKLIVGLSVVFAIALGVGFTVSDVGSDNFLVNRIFRQTEVGVSDSTLGSRFVTYGIALDVISEDPFVGTGSSEIDSVMSNGFRVHNIFLLGFVEGGILKFLGLVLIFCSAIGMFWNSSISSAYGRDWKITSAALFVCLLVSVSLSPVSIRRIAWLPFLIILAPAFSSQSGARDDAYTLHSQARNT